MIQTTPEIGKSIRAGGVMTNYHVAIFTYDHDRFVTDELAELRYRASIRPGMQESFSSMFPQPRQRGVDSLAAYEDRLHELRAPTLVVHGREDQVIPLISSQKLFQVLNNAQLHVFGRCGHWTQIEHDEGETTKSYASRFSHPLYPKASS